MAGAAGDGEGVAFSFRDAEPCAAMGATEVAVFASSLPFEFQDVEKFAEGGVFLSAGGEIAREDAEEGVAEEEKGERSECHTYPRVRHKCADDLKDERKRKGGV